MTKRDVLIFLSDVSNREICDYVMDVFEAGTEHLITEEQAQRFKEWLAGKLADSEEDDSLEDDVLLINDNDVSTIYQPDE